MPSRALLVAAAALTAVSTATLTGCGGDTGSASEAGVSDRLTVVTSFYPLEFLTRKVAGDRAEVSNLTAAGVEPHDLELTPKQVGSLSEAALVVYEKGLQPAVDKAVEQNAGHAGLDVSAAARLIDTGAHADDEHDGEESPEHADEGDPTGLDPHFWLDPIRLADVADAVADKLAEVDNAGADGYHQRAAQLRTELTTLDGEFMTGLARCVRTVFVTTHEAFGYLAKRYGLQMVGIAGMTPDAEPSPARVKQVRDIISQQKVTTIFYEELVSPKVAKSIARDLHVRSAVLSPIEGPADSGATEDYPSLMRRNLSELKQANGCG